MTFLPIVERELRLKSRRPRTYGFRCGMVLAFALIIFGILAVDWSAGQNPTVMGQHLFWTLSGLAFACALLAGPVVTADCLCEEKREGTLGLLFLTNGHRFLSLGHPQIEPGFASGRGATLRAAAFNGIELAAIQSQNRPRFEQRSLPVVGRLTPGQRIRAFFV